MKRSFITYLLPVLVLILNSNCEKEKETIDVPTLSTSSVSIITDTTIICGGNIISDGGAPITAVGVCWGESENPTTTSERTIDGTGVINYTSVIKGFLPGRVYHIRAYATNIAGTAYGEDITATTNTILPKISTIAAYSITISSAFTGGNLQSDGGAAITARGVCWNSTGHPTVDDAKTTENSDATYFVSQLTGLEIYQVYYLRAYATNSCGTAYGEEITFRTNSSLMVTDVDGNKYNTVAIGTKVWMAENLKTVHYRNGILIPEVTDDNAWYTQTKGAFCKYNNDPALRSTYGNLYNFYVVTDTSKICPSGWHVPARWEWDALIDNLGGISIAGGAMKEAGLFHWESPNTGATNSSGFSALPGGTRGDYNDGRFSFESQVADFWTSESASFIEIVTNSDDVINNIGTSEISGKSIRCVKD